MPTSDVADREQALTADEARLLLLVSRPRLTAEQQELALTLAHKVTNWGNFTATAWRKYTLPMVFENLSAVPGAPVPQETLDAMRLLSMRVCADMLRKQATFDEFHKSCVLETGIEHVYFKGPALAHRFYPDPLKRFYRDIDILIPHEKRTSFIRALLEKGGQVVVSDHQGLTLRETMTDAELAELLASRGVPSIMMQQHLLVEVHVEQNLQEKLFKGQNLLKDPVQVNMPGLEINTLRDTVHVAQILHHHTRHIWSKLNWMADLDAICTHPEFDREALLAYGESLRIRRTLEAALELHALAAQGAHPQDFTEMTPGRDLLRACVDGLVGDTALEKEMKREYRKGILFFPWQEMPVTRWEALVLWLRNLRPDLVDFDEHKGRLPPFWLRYMKAVSARFSRGAAIELRRIIFRRA